MSDASVPENPEHLYSFNIKEALLSYCPTNPKDVFMQGRKVGRVVGFHQEGDSYIADIVLTDPEAKRLVLGKPPTTCSFERREGPCV